MKKILFVLQDIPFPAKHGSRMRTWSIINALYKEYDLSVICWDFKQGESALSEAQKYFKNIWIVPRKSLHYKTEKLSIFQRFLNFAQYKPWEIAKAYSQIFDKYFQTITARFHFDIIFARYVAYQGQYLLNNKSLLRGTKLIIDIDDIGPILTERNIEIRGTSGFYDKNRQKINLFFYRQYYKKLTSINSCLVCSDLDRHFIHEKISKKINLSVVPNTVCSNSFQGKNIIKKNIFENKVILFCANLSYKLNADAIIWFAKFVLPKIKQKCKNAKLHVVGWSPPDEVKALTQSTAISVYANVPDVSEYYRNSLIAIAPLLSGGGSRIKLIEAMSFMRPIVATAIGAEGLDLENNKHCFIADTPVDFAKACIALLSNYNLAVSMSESAYRHFRENFNRNQIKRKIQEVFSSV